MTTDALKYSAPVGRIIIRDRVRTAAVIAGGMLMFVALAFVTAKYIALENSLQRGEYLTTDQILNGGKRFIDYFWSLNSRSVDKDQYTAARMFVNKAAYDKRVEYLVRSDFVGKVKRARIISEIDWENATVTVLDPEEGQPENTLRVEYKGELIVNRQKAVPWHMILVLTPTDFTNENPTGVGVVSYVDIAEEPIL